MDAFAEATEQLLERPGVTRTQMMGHPCLRLQGEMFASYDEAHSTLVVKLGADRTAALVTQAGHHPFAPRGSAFKEWVGIDETCRAQWPALLEEAFERASMGAAGSR